MPQLTQGQGSTPYEGANIFGAGVAGYETPVGTNLSPEAEHMLRAALIKQMTGIAKLKMEMAIQSITSSTNILVSVQRASTEAISSAVSMAQLGHLNNKRLGDLLLKITDASGAMRAASGHSYEEKSKNRILGAGGDLAKRQVAAGRSGSGPASTIDQIMATAVRDNYTSEEIGHALVRMISANNNDFGRTVSSTIDELKASGADLVTIVDTKNLAKQQVAHGLDLAVQEAIDRLQKHGAHPKHIKYIKDNDLVIKKRSFYSGLKPADVKSLTVNNIDQRTADKIRAEGSIKIEALSRFTQSLGVGVPRNLTDSLNKLVDISTSMVEDGPEAFAKSLYSMPTPLSVQLTEQKVQYQMDQLDNPTDPLSEAVARYASVIPYFSNYMAAMGMDDPLTAVEYLMEHPSDRQEYFNIINVLAKTGKIDQINNPEALQERLRVAGSSDQDSIFRTSFLTKPIERLFGIGLNRPEAWRYFDGRNSNEQLENAIKALEKAGDENFKKELKDSADNKPVSDKTGESLEETDAASADMSDSDAKVVEDVVSTDDDLSEMLESPEDDGPAHRQQVALTSFASGLPEGKRKRALSAAQKYLQRIDKTYTPSGQGDEDGRFRLSGIKPSPVPVIKEEPAPPPVVPAESKKTYPGMGTGYDQFGLKKIEEQVRKEREAVPVPVPVPTLEIDSEPTVYTAKQLERQAAIKAKREQLKLNRQKQSEDSQ